MLTNHPPSEAKQRFLRPDSLRPPRELNPGVDPTVDQAVLWAMELHPDKRPQDVKIFRKALFGTAPAVRVLPYSPSTFIQPFFISTIDRLLAATAVILLIIATIATFQ